MFDSVILLVPVIQDIPNKEETHTVGIFYFSQLNEIFQLLHLYGSVAQTSTSLCLKICLIWSNSEKLNVTNVSR